MVFELKIKLQHYCPFTEFSKNNYGKRKVLQYCGDEFDYLVLPSPITDEILDNGYYLFNQQKDKNFKVFGDGSVNGIVTLKCICDDPETDSLVNLISKSGGMIIYPIIYENGYEIHKIFCHNYEELTNILNTLNTRVTELEIISIKDIGEDSLLKQSSIISHVIDQLTNKQMDILIQSYEKGYYEIPRKIRVQDIAEELKVTRYAVERNIRSAENKLLRSLMPYLYIRKFNVHHPDITHQVINEQKQEQISNKT